MYRYIFSSSSLAARLSRCPTKLYFPRFGEPLPLSRKSDFLAACSCNPLMEIDFSRSFGSVGLNPHPPPNPPLNPNPLRPARYFAPNSSSSRAGVPFEHTHAFFTFRTADPPQQ